MAAASPTISIIFFLVITIIYSVIKYYTATPSATKSVSIIYFLLLILIQFYINLGLTKEICGFSNFKTALYATLWPWLIIYGSITVFLVWNPSWLSPFSNTIGYLFTYISGIDGFFKEILLDKPNTKTDNTSIKNSDMISAIKNVYEDKSLLINSITTSNLSEWWNVLKTGGLLKSTVKDEDLIKLTNYIKMKTTVAEFMWSALAGLLTTSVSYNAILNSGCEQSVKEMEKRHAQYLEKESKIAKSKEEKNSSQMVYKSYE